MEGRSAIVTGGGKRVGAELVAALLEDGWTVIAHVHQEDDNVIEGAIRVVANLERPDCYRPIFEAAEGHPPVRLLINNAARFRFDGFDDPNADEFDSHLRINVRAPMLLIAELARRHRDGEALVINILDAKLASPNPDFLSYTLSKFTLAGLNELAARALAERGIRVNAIAPALMLPSGYQGLNEFKAVHDLNPLRRGVETYDVVAAMRYLINSRSVTGQTLAIDSGQRFLALPRDVQFLENQ